MIRCQRCMKHEAVRNYPVSDFTVPVCDRCFRVLVPGIPVRPLEGQQALPV